MDKELAAQVDALCSKLIESYKLILKRSRIEDESVQEYEQLQLSTATESIVQSCDRLLAIVHQARLRTIVRVGLSEAATELSSEQLRMEIASLQNKEIS